LSQGGEGKEEGADLVIEVDGDVHDLQKEEDARREKVLREMGLRTCADGCEECRSIARFRNEEVVMNASRSAVVGKIRELVSK